MIFYFISILCHSVYEYYGEKFKLSAITPTKLIPIPREIMEKYKQRKVANVSIYSFLILFIIKLFHFNVTQVKSVRDANYEKQQVKRKS